MNAVFLVRTLLAAAPQILLRPSTLVRVELLLLCFFRDNPVSDFRRIPLTSDGERKRLPSAKGEREVIGGYPIVVDLLGSTSLDRRASSCDN